MAPPYAVFFRILAWLSLAGGLAAAWLAFAGGGWLATLWPASGAVVAFILWQALAWGLETLDAIKARATETASDVAQLLAHQTAPTAPRPSMVFAQPNPAPLRAIADAPLWPNALVALQPVAAHNGVTIAAEPNGQWTARKDGETTLYANAGDLAAWLKTLPRP